MRKRILLAEDDEDIVQTYMKVFKLLGYSVQVTKNGQECINAYRHALFLAKDTDDSHPFDVVVIDYAMPIKDGATLAQEILKEDQGQRIIFISGHGNILLSKLDSIKRKIDFMSKPVPLPALISKIEGKSPKEIVERLKGGLKKWDGYSGLSEPFGAKRTINLVH